MDMLLLGDMLERSSELSDKIISFLYMCLSNWNNIAKCKLPCGKDVASDSTIPSS